MNNPAIIPLLVKWIQRALFGGAAVLLTWCGYALLDSWSFQRSENLRFQEIRSMQNPAAAEVSPVVLPALPRPGKMAPDTADVIGRLEVERLGVLVMVAEGTSDATLRHAAGHIAGTALPGQAGNIGISAHRDTFFRPLRNIERDDIISLTTPLGDYRYRVLGTSVVSPSEVSVLEQGDDEILTLVTCYPFYFVGPAPRRFVVRAEKIPSVTN